MIIINDNDLPITAAEKIINGTKPVDGLTEALQKAVCGNDCKTGADMFDIEEIKEIADYLYVYYNSNKND